LILKNHTVASNLKFPKRRGKKKQHMHLNKFRALSFPFPLLSQEPNRIKKQRKEIKRKGREGKGMQASLARKKKVHCSFFPLLHC
jgi:hypothetical protein